MVTPTSFAKERGENMGGLILVLNEITSWEVVGIVLIVAGYILIDVMFTIRHNDNMKVILSEQNSRGRIMNNGKYWNEIWRLLDGKD